MENLLIRKAVRPDIEVIKHFDHAMKTKRVWQMQQSDIDGELETRFIETHLPREMRIVYPHSPELLEVKWNDFSGIYVACADQVPVGYISLVSYFSPDLVWIKDLVTNEIWRRKGVASKLIEMSITWAKDRDIQRVLLEMSSKNFPGISLAKKAGFEYSGFNDNYFMNRDIALFFTRDLRNRVRG